MKRIQTTVAVLGFALLCCSGCKTLSPPNWAKAWYTEEAPKIAESKFPKPVRLAAVWSPALLNSPGKKPTRGFGGRMYFYDANNKAIPVEGQLVVYGYDDSRQRTDGKTPDRKYAFTPEQFTEHFSETDLGASYSVWIPWDEVGCPQVDISLVPIFTATSGQLIVGQSSKNLLPGPTTENAPTKFEHLMMPPPQISSQPGPADVQRAAFEQMVPQPAGPQNTALLQETTLRVPGTLAEQLAKADPQASPGGQFEAARSQPIGNVNQERAERPVPRTTGTTTSAAPSVGLSRAPWGSLPATSPSNQPSARFVRPTHPAPSSPGPQPTSGLPQSPPFPAAQPFAPPASLTPGQQTGRSAAW